jgi:hypothetical protein
MCHIEGVGKKALRYNKSLTREERDAYENLILLCKNHHAIIDHDEIKYTVAELKRMKAEHERQGRMETFPKDEKFARICIDNITTRRTTNVYSRTYNNSCHFEAPVGVVNFSGPAPKKMTAPPDAIQNDARKRAYIIRLRTIFVDSDTYRKSKKASAAILNNAIKKKFGTTALLVSVHDFHELSSFIKEKIDQSIPGRKSLRDKGRPLYEPFIE